MKSVGPDTDTNTLEHCDMTWDLPLQYMHTHTSSPSALEVVALDGTLCDLL